MGEDTVGSVATNTLSATRQEPPHISIFFDKILRFLNTAVLQGREEEPHIPKSNLIF